MRLALERNNEEAFKKIGNIITREKQRSFWRRLNSSPVKNEPAVQRLSKSRYNREYSQSRLRRTQSKMQYSARYTTNNTPRQKRLPFVAANCLAILGTWPTPRHPRPSLTGPTNRRPTLTKQRQNFLMRSRPLGGSFQRTWPHQSSRPNSGSGTGPLLMRRPCCQSRVCTLATISLDASRKSWRTTTPLEFQ
jgi:hypothetical protein